MVRVCSEGEWLVARACAKVNLFLDVVAKREDGYHQLQTIFAPVDYLADTLRVRSGVGFTLSCQTPGVPVDASNLVIRAARLLATRCKIDAGAEFELIKRIPHGGGLGGGSSDAAAALILCNELWGTGLDICELAGLALEVGSDVPYFLYGGVCRGEGRGEELEVLEGIPLPSFAIFIPPWQISTVEAFRHLNPANFNQGGIDAYIADLRSGEIFSSSYNAFEQAVFSFEPRQKDIMQRLRGCGCSVRLSGSGSCCWLLVDEHSLGLEPSLRERIIFPPC